MLDATPFFLAIRNDPDDKISRLALADWIDDNEEYLSDWFIATRDFIRVACHMDRDEDRAESAAWLKANKYRIMALSDRWPFLGHPNIDAFDGLSTEATLDLFRYGTFYRFSSTVDDTIDCAVRHADYMPTAVFIPHDVIVVADAPNNASGPWFNVIDLHRDSWPQNHPAVIGRGTDGLSDYLTFFSLHAAERAVSDGIWEYAHRRRIELGDPIVYGGPR